MYYESRVSRARISIDFPSNRYAISLGIGCRADRDTSLDRDESYLIISLSQGRDQNLISPLYDSSILIKTFDLMKHVEITSSVKFSENSTKSITPRCEIDVLRLSGIKEEKKNC